MLTLHAQSRAWGNLKKKKIFENPHRRPQFKKILDCYN